MAAKRTTHRSTSGTKLYAVRDSKGRFKDIQTYKRAHVFFLKIPRPAKSTLFHYSTLFLMEEALAGFGEGSIEPPTP